MSFVSLCKKTDPGNNTVTMPDILVFHLGFIAIITVILYVAKLNKNALKCYIYIQEILPKITHNNYYMIEKRVIGFKYSVRCSSCRDGKMQSCPIN